MPFFSFFSAEILGKLSKTYTFPKTFGLFAFPKIVREVFIVPKYEIKYLISREFERTNRCGLKPLRTDDLQKQSVWCR